MLPRNTTIYSNVLSPIMFIVALLICVASENIRSTGAEDGNIQFYFINICFIILIYLLGLKDSNHTDSCIIN